MKVLSPNLSQDIMKTPKICLFLAGAVGALILGACSTPDTRIQADPATFARLTPQQQAMVKAGQVSIGMDMPTVKLAMGDADRVTMRSDTNGQTQVWHYVTYEDNGVILYTGYYHRGWSGRRGWGGWGWWGPDYPYFMDYPNRSVHDRLRVEFGANNLVVAVTQESN
jgi:hypothetical protein